VGGATVGESTVGTFMLARDGEEKPAPEKAGAGVDDFALRGVAGVWKRMSNAHRLHFIDEGVFDGGVAGAGGVVVDSGKVGEFARFGQMAGDDVLVGGGEEGEGGELGQGSTCTLIGVARHCLWYVRAQTKCARSKRAQRSERKELSAKKRAKFLVSVAHVRARLTVPLCSLRSQVRREGRRRRLR
jgi:hypothetical protein